MAYQVWVAEAAWGRVWVFCPCQGPWAFQDCCPQDWASLQGRLGAGFRPACLASPASQALPASSSRRLSLYSSRDRDHSTDTGAHRGRHRR